MSYPGDPQHPREDPTAQAPPHAAGARGPGEYHGGVRDPHRGPQPHRAPSLDVLAALADALDVAPWELLTDRRLPADPYRSTDRLLARALRSLTPPDLELLLDLARRLAMP